MPTKFLLLGGGGGGVMVFWKGGGWKCQFYFYGRGDFSEVCPFSRHNQMPLKQGSNALGTKLPFQ